MKSLKKSNKPGVKFTQEEQKPEQNLSIPSITNQLNK